ncbi:hypothetical protein P4O66_006092, partial [Electrophorus voltai]
CDTLSLHAGMVEGSCRCRPCRAEQYAYMRGDEHRCEDCTGSCSDDKVEVAHCTNTTNRVCHCKPGFYCPSPTKVDCRRECLACTGGSFSNTTSLATSCQSYTDCARQGMVVIAEGTSTRDRVCGWSMATSDPIHAPAVPDTPALMTFLAPNSIPSTISTTLEPLETSKAIESKSQQQTTSQSLWSSLNIGPASSTKGSIVLQPNTQSSGQSTWVVLLLLVMLFSLVLMCLPVWCKRKALKDKLDWPSLAFWKCYLASASAHHKVETSVPLCDKLDSEGGQDMGSGSCPHSHQQVTMEHGGKGERIHNAVGSIVIYSPGMVILGSNSSERKEDAREGGDEHLLVTAPQKESSCVPQEDSLGLAMQEELGKELSFPVPATGK